MWKKFDKYGYIYNIPLKFLLLLSLQYDLLLY